MSNSFATPWTVAHQAALSMGLPRQEYQSGLLFPSPGDPLNPGANSTSHALAGRFFTTEPPGKPNCNVTTFKKIFYCAPLWKTMWRFLKKLEIELPYDPTKSHSWAYTPRKAELKETHVPQCSSQHCL